MVETKQKLTKGEKRRAEREYKEEKNLGNGARGMGHRGARNNYSLSTPAFTHTRTPLNPGLFAHKPPPPPPTQSPLTSSFSNMQSLSGPQMNLFPHNKPAGGGNPRGLFGDTGALLSNLLNNPNHEHSFISSFPTAPAPKFNPQNPPNGINPPNGLNPLPTLPNLNFLNNSTFDTSNTFGSFPSSCLPDQNTTLRNSSTPQRLHDQQQGQQVISIDSE